MKIADTIVSWLTLILGVIHCAFTRRAYPEFGLPALWFLGSGLFIILVAAANLLRIRYAGVAAGVRAVCILANLALLALAIAIARVVPLKGNPQVVISIVLAALLTIFSIVRRPARA